MFRNVFSICLLAILLPAAANADDLTKMIQKDLVALGYDPGNIQGELSTETVVAISTFQAENDIDVDGKASPQLAGVLKARLKARNSGGEATAPAAASAPMDPAALQAARDACLQERILAAQQAKKKKKGFGSLIRAVANTATRFGGNDLAREVSETSRDIYDVNATAGDWERAAKDMGLTTADIEACQNPPM
tara:strand:- start:13580 stop:14158 length:579 start_codon:yes stop_codon:yes gene_type:complete